MLKKILGLGILLCLASFAYAQQQETVTITTYYPSPYGSYNQLYVADKLGIGTANPGVKLHIGGIAGTDGIMFPDGSLQTSAGGGGWVFDETSYPNRSIPEASWYDLDL